MEDTTLLLPPQVVAALRWSGHPDDHQQLLDVLGDHVRFDTIRRHVIPSVHYELWLYPTKDGSAQFVPVGYWVLFNVALNIAWSVTDLDFRAHYQAWVTEPTPD